MSATEASGVDRRGTRRPADVHSLRLAHEMAQARLARAFWIGAPVGELVRERARTVDELLLRAWSVSCAHQPDLALIAVGGYGRGELHPHSDVDLLVLLPAELPAGANAAVEAFIAQCWDMGLDLGHSMRSVKQCVAAAQADVGVATTLMEARLLAGPETLFVELLTATGPERLWPGRDFFQAKQAEQQSRHARYHDTAYNLEPNLKEGPGGLRDIQMVGWVAKRHLKAQSLHDLVAAGFLKPDEYQELVQGQHQLWAIRFALHLVAARAEERLLFDYQRELAERLGYRDEHRRNLGVEQFMRHYFRTVKTLELLSDMLLERYRETLLHADETGTARHLGAHFTVRRNALEVRDPDLFEREPAALLELFRVLAQEPELEGVSADTLRLIRIHADRISQLQGDARAQAAFMGLLREPVGVARELQRMSRFGILGRYLPAFGRIVGHMQYDLFHAYTVDQHSLFVVRNLRRFAKPQYREQFPLACDIFQRLDKPELLYLAGLFHDIAKGRGGDHSALGAQEAERFALAHGLSPVDAHLVAWLVRHHLLMSACAQRRDISDPEVVNDFARETGDRRHLDYLYLLTIADIAATSPKLWNSWKDRLLAGLYTATRYALRRGLGNPIDREEWIAETRAQALALLAQSQLDRARIEGIWKALPKDYFLRLSADRIAWQTKAIAQRPDADSALIKVRHAPRLGATEVFVYTRDREHLFATIVATLDNLGLNVVEARIITTENDYAWDSFLVLDAEGRPLVGKPAEKELHQHLARQLKHDPLQPPNVTRLNARRLKHFTASVSVEFAPSTDSGRSQLAIVTTDRPGLLSLIGRTFSECRIQVHDARIATFGERVEDFFSISTQDGGSVDEPDIQRALRNKLISQLDDAAENCDTTWPQND